MISQKLMALERGEIKKLIVCIPPRHGKSTLISYYFPVWWLWRNPNDNIILTAYEQGFASYWGGKARELLETSNLGIRLKEDSKAKNFWRVAGYEGNMTSVGIGGAITGRGAKLLIIDDIIKNASEAKSKAIKAKHLDWYRSVAKTRLDNQDGRQVFCVTRWAEDDLVGILLNEEKDWTYLRLPAIAENTEYWENGEIFRNEGEPLCPELFSYEALMKIKEEIGAVWWSALYQQNPLPALGTVFKIEWFKYYEINNQGFILESRFFPFERCIYFQAVDLATTFEGGDFSVIGTFALTPEGDLIIVDIFRKRVEAWRLADIILEKYNKRYAFILIESSGFQTSFFQEIVRKGIPAKPFQPKESKEIRAIPLATKIEQGKVWFKRDASWFPELRDELLAFPLGNYDDQVDTLSMAVIESSTLKGYTKRTRFLEKESFLGGLNEF